MDFIRHLKGTESGGKTRVIFRAPPSRDLGDQPSPYAEMARSQDDSPLPTHWVVERYLESTEAVSRATYIVQQRKTSSRKDQAVQADPSESQKHKCTRPMLIRTTSVPVLIPSSNNTLQNSVTTERPESELGHRSDMFVRAPSDSIHLEYVDIIQDHISPVEPVPEKVDEPPIKDQEGTIDQITKVTEAVSNVEKKKGPIKAKLNLGPARQIGISKAGAQKRPKILKVLEESRAKKICHKEISTTASSTIKETNSIDDVSEHSFAAISDKAETTAGFESIAPPPAYKFTLAKLTSIAKLLNQSEEYLSMYQGGKHENSQALFGVLAIIRRVGQIDSVPDFKAQNRKEIERCEVMIQDAQGYSLKVLLQGNCATRWTGEQTEFDTSPALEDHTGLIDSILSMDDTTILGKRDDVRFMPIQEGDVVHINNLKLVRSSKSKNNQLQPCQPMAAGASKEQAYKIFAIGSEANQTNLELCWRSTGHLQKTFDPHLIHIDGRCNAIYQLHKSWMDCQ